MFSEPIIQNLLANYVESKGHWLFAPNIYLFKEDWEIDFMSVTRKQMVHEWEIKISVGDFKQDFKKYKHLYYGRTLELQTSMPIEKYRKL